MSWFKRRSSSPPPVPFLEGKFVHIARHAEAEIIGPEYQLSEGLLAEGRHQARMLEIDLKNHGFFEYKALIIASALPRAVQTAEIAAAGRVPVVQSEEYMRLSMRPEAYEGRIHRTLNQIGEAAAWEVAVQPVSILFVGHEALMKKIHPAVSMKVRVPPIDYGAVIMYDPAVLPDHNN